MGIRYESELPKSADLVVVGGGIVGAATAFHAARAGLRPLLIERRPALSSLTTAAAAGGFRLQFDNEEEYRLIRESVELFLNFEEATEQREYDPDVRRQGYLWLTTQERRAEEQREIVEAQRSWGLSDVEILDADALRREFRWVSPDVIQARFRQDDGLLDPRRTALGLVAGSRAPVLTSCAVTGFRLDSQRALTGVETTDGLVSTRAAVIAAGPFSAIVARGAGVELPLTIVQRQKVVLPEVPEVPPNAPMTIDEDSGAHWRPGFRGAFLLFTDPSTPASPPAENLPIDQNFAFQLLEPDSPQAVARVAPFWRDVWDRGVAHWMIQAGQYDISPDRRPLLGSLPVEGLFVNTGYSGHGVMGAPAGSRVVVDVITGRLPSQENPFGPDREFEERAHLDVL
jgi:glycine/D-amino acid oxidase-like deaminating enzyme